MPSYEPPQCFWGAPPQTLAPPAPLGKDTEVLAMPQSHRPPDGVTIPMVATQPPPGPPGGENPNLEGPRKPSDAPKPFWGHKPAPGALLSCHRTPQAARKGQICCRAPLCPSSDPLVPTSPPALSPASKMGVQGTPPNHLHELFLHHVHILGQTQLWGHSMSPSLTKPQNR